ncbi:hypothetical protein [Microbulbifer discodermiae]|uniref:hypothetical protein n=1 Tax=Microbulbifer sp. 2201CG32-9 TaxID=3232309 RepID=UPI00345BF914
MIDSKENPVEWSQLMSELKGVHEHLGDLIKEMGSKGSIDIEGYSIDIAHIYAYLSRAWNSREFKGEMSKSQWEEFRSFPSNLELIA